MPTTVATAIANTIIKGTGPAPTTGIELLRCQRKARCTWQPGFLGARTPGRSGPTQRGWSPNGTASETSKLPRLRKQLRGAGGGSAFRVIFPLYLFPDRQFIL